MSEFVEQLQSQLVALEAERTEVYAAVRRYSQLDQRARVLAELIQEMELQEVPHE